MRLVILLIASIWAGPAMAHIGHLGEVAGHGHWLGAAALGAAIALGLWQGLKGKGDSAQAEDDADEAGDEEPQEA